jgi:hypothetical protein
MTSNRGRKSAASSTAVAFRDEVTTAILVCTPRDDQAVVSTPRNGRMPSSRSTELKNSFLRLPRRRRSPSQDCLLDHPRPAGYHARRGTPARRRNGLPVDVVEVVAIDVWLINAALGQEVNEELAPRPHVHLSGRGQHAIQVEQGGVVGMPVHTMKIRAWQAPTRRTDKSVRPPQNEGSAALSKRKVRSWLALSNPNPVLVEVVRNGFIESVHRGRVAITNSDGSLASSVGADFAPMYPRSANKPLQAVGMLRAGS